MRIAIDIDSTLHHYWDQLEEIAHRRFGVTIPYENQVVWTIDRLKPEQLSAVVKETHTEPHIMRSEPYPGAVEAVRAWHEAGHFIHITSHRACEAHEATERWLDAMTNAVGDTDPKAIGYIEKSAVDSSVKVVFSAD